MNNNILIAKLKNIQNEVSNWLATGINIISGIPGLWLELEKEQKTFSSVSCNSIITVDFKNSMQNDVKIIDDSKKDT